MIEYIVIKGGIYKTERLKFATILSYTCDEKVRVKCFIIFEKAANTEIIFIAYIR